MSDISNLEREPRIDDEKAAARRRDDARARGDVRSDPAFEAETRDDPAPLSDALHIPTLIDEDSNRRAPAPRRDDPAPLSDALQIPTLIGEHSDTRASSVRERDPSTPRGETPPREAWGEVDSTWGELDSNRMTTPAKAPGPDAGSMVGVPSNHPQTHLSERLATLDKAAYVVGAVMTLGPLFAAMMGRMGY